MQNFFTIINPKHWSMHTLLVVGGMVWIILILLSIEPIVRATVLKKFYQDVAMAAQYSDELTFANYITKTQFSTAESSSKRRGGGYHFANCSSAGMYQNNVTNVTIYNAYSCSKSFVKYYGVSEFNEQTVADLKKEMTAVGWRTAGDEYNVDDSVRDIQQHSDGTVRGYSFKRGDINADMLFITRGSADYQSWCHNLREGCRHFEKAGSTYRNVMVVSVSAYKGYED